MTVHLIIPDPHAHPEHHNYRAELLGKFILDIKPDKVICLGDGADMESLRTNEKGSKSFEGKRYKKDIEAWLDFQDKMWHPTKRAKKRLPESYFIIGNHEQRINKTINQNPELEGLMSIDDLQLGDYWDAVIPYEGNTPGVVEIDDVLYSHYATSGVMGTPISGINLARNLILKKLQSYTVGHNHTLDYNIQSSASGKRLQGLCAGVFQDYRATWAGQANELWWHGLIVKKFTSNGYDPMFVSMESLYKQYGK